MHPSFLRLNEEYQLRVIRDDHELSEASLIVSRLICSESPDAGEAEYIEVLSELIWAYEQKTDVIDSANDSGAITEVNALIEERKLLQNRASVMERCLSDGTQECPGERADKRIQLTAMKLYIDALTSRIVRFSEE